MLPLNTYQFYHAVASTGLCGIFFITAVRGAGHTYSVLAHYHHMGFAKSLSSRRDVNPVQCAMIHDPCITYSVQKIHYQLSIKPVTNESSNANKFLRKEDTPPGAAPPGNVSSNANKFLRKEDTPLQKHGLTNV